MATWKGCTNDYAFLQEAYLILCSPHDKPFLSCPETCLQKSVWHEFLTHMDLAWTLMMAVLWATSLLRLWGDLTFWLLFFLNLVSVKIYSIWMSFCTLHLDRYCIVSTLTWSNLQRRDNDSASARHTNSKLLLRLGHGKMSFACSHIEDMQNSFVNVIPELTVMMQ